MIDKDAFINCLRSLFNIDGYLLPELSENDQRAFVRNPAQYFICTDGEQQSAIWREVQKRQRPSPSSESPDETA